MVKRVRGVRAGPVTWIARVGEARAKRTQRISSLLGMEQAGGELVAVPTWLRHRTLEPDFPHSFPTARDALLYYSVTPLYLEHKLFIAYYTELLHLLFHEFKLVHPT
jgi:hypothetical protein